MGEKLGAWEAKAQADENVMRRRRGDILPSVAVSSDIISSIETLHSHHTRSPLLYELGGMTKLECSSKEAERRKKPN